ncbi:hypothetical protein GCM10011374_03060 [Kocuria dechangensis]|uniref:Uncharacterized protein n=1 Tax=Kocuria dechangensis TaxID=1176249 RepID=A0A917GGA6_9MICC|nr:hypothetical protein [Kocuria dechangensis]GGG44080.1 hypothetical protein GCM10011374_03060 [Kocuria dechangensis]
MVYDPERERRNDAVYAEHKQALARGEKRVLRTTATGELHSYAGEEIGFTPGAGQVQVSTWWGMGIVTAVLWAGFAFSWVLLLAPVREGGQPFWGALFLTVLAGLLGWYTFRLARDEYRAAKLRKERGAPKPGTSGRLPT